MKDLSNKPTGSNQSAGSFINGRAQVVELLQLLGSDEKVALLKNMRIKNPQLALELSKESLSFQQLEKLSGPDTKMILNYVPAPILGVALKGASSSLQRRILGLVAREYAEEAYGIMISPLRDEASGKRRAQEKILNIMLDLHQKKQISFL